MEECRLETTDMVIARFIASLRFVSSSCWTRSIRFARLTDEEELAHFPPELTSALSFPSSPSPGEIVIVRLDSPVSFLHPRARASFAVSLPLRYF